MFVTVTVQVALTIGCSQQPAARANSPPTDSTSTQTIVTSTPIEKALDDLRARFPNSIVIGFEELFDPRPDSEPQVDLGPQGLALAQVLNRVGASIRSIVGFIARQAGPCVSSKRNGGIPSVCSTSDYVNSPCRKTGVLASSN